MNASFRAVLLYAVLPFPAAADTVPDLPRPVKPAEGFSVSNAVTASLVERPVEACFDDRGRLYVTEVTGTNDKPEEQLKSAPHRLLRLEDTNNDGVFDRRTVFADKLGFPEGVLWHGGVVYVSVVPQILKFTDTNDDGVADTRSVWFDGKTLTGCANDLHGPYAGPDGLIYWCKGAFAEQTHDLPAEKNWKSRAAHVFRMKPDGTDFDCVFTAGMDNPVGLEWLPEGDLIVSGTFLQHPGDGRRDGLIHAVRGGVWGKDHNVLDGHIRTGPLMPAMTHLGPAAPCGLCRYGRDLLLCQFNMRKVSRHVPEPLGSTWQTKDSDFLTCEDPDFHPTDVLQAPDGSVLVIDTGGWYKICCPTSQISRPEMKGTIYRLRKAGGEISPACPEPRWKLENPPDSVALRKQIGSSNLHIRRKAAELLGPRVTNLEGIEKDSYTDALLKALTMPDTDRFLEHALIYALIEAKGGWQTITTLSERLSTATPAEQRAALYFFSQADGQPAMHAEKAMMSLLASPDPGVREALVFGIKRVPLWRELAAGWLQSRISQADDPAALRGAVEAVAGEGDFRAALGSWLSTAKSGPVQCMLLEVMTEAAGRQEFAGEWTGPLLTVIEGSDSAAAQLAAGVLAAKPAKLPDAVRERLAGMVKDAQRPAGVRLALLQALRPVTPAEAEFALLMDALPGPNAAQAALVLSTAKLSSAQLHRLAAALPGAGLLERPVLLRAFAGASDESLGLAVVVQLEKGHALAGLSPQMQAECLGKFPEKVQQALASARTRLNAGAAQQLARLDELEKTLPAGDSIRGKVVFQSAKASCVLCHQAGYFGKHVGPDLSKIGSIRTKRDLLEAIAFPSAGFVRSYEPVEIRRKDGTVAYGIVKEQSSRSVTLVTGAVTPEATIPATEIAAMNPGTASLMPQGIDLILSPQELADLVAFLQSLR